MVSCASQSLRPCTVGLWLSILRVIGSSWSRVFPSQMSVSWRKHFAQASATHWSLGIAKSLFKKCWNCWSAISCKITGVTLSSVCYKRWTKFNDKLGQRADLEWYAQSWLVSSLSRTAVHGLGDVCTPWRGCKHMFPALTAVLFLPRCPWLWGRWSSQKGEVEGV